MTEMVPAEGFKKKTLSKTAEYWFRKCGNPPQKMPLSKSFPPMKVNLTTANATARSNSSIFAIGTLALG